MVKPSKPTVTNLALVWITHAEFTQVGSASGSWGDCEGMSTGTCGDWRVDATACLSFYFKQLYFSGMQVTGGEPCNVHLCNSIRLVLTRGLKLGSCEDMLEIVLHEQNLLSHDQPHAFVCLSVHPHLSELSYNKRQRAECCPRLAAYCRAFIVSKRLTKPAPSLFSVIN